MLRARAFIESVGRKKGRGVHTCTRNDTGEWHVLDARHFTSYDEFNFKSQSFKVSGRPIAIVVLGRMMLPLVGLLFIVLIYWLSLLLCAFFQPNSKFQLKLLFFVFGPGRPNPYRQRG